jgi:hypothetical protein
MKLEQCIMHCSGKITWKFLVLCDHTVGLTDLTKVWFCSLIQCYQTWFWSCNYYQIILFIFNTYLLYLNNNNVRYRQKHNFNWGCWLQLHVSTYKVIFRLIFWTLQYHRGFLRIWYPKCAQTPYDIVRFKKSAWRWLY